MKIQNKTKKNIQYTLFALSAFVIVASVMYGVPSMANASSLVTKDMVVSPNPGPEKFKAAGEPVMTSSMNADTITAKRGETVTVALTLNHESGSNLNGKFTVTPKVDGFVVPASVLNSTTMQERATMLANGQIPNGVISLKDLVKFSPSSVTLNSGESKQIQMQVTLPANLSDEIVGHSLIISPTYDISGKTGIDTMGVFTTSMNINVQR